MKRKKKLIRLLLLVTVCLFGILAIGGIAVAAGVTLTESSTLMLDSYKIERFNSYTSGAKGLWGIFKGDTIPNAINGIANLFYTGTKIIYQLFDTAIALMYSLNILDKLSEIVGELTNSLWGTFKSNYVSLVVIISVLIVARTFFLESSKEAVKQLAKVIFVLIVAGIWFPRANEYLNKMNDYSFLLQASLMQTASSVNSTADIVGGGTWKVNDYGELVKEVDADQANELATNTIRNELFIQTVYHPFLLLNYGTADATAINEMYTQAEDEDIPKDTGGEYLISDEFAKLSADEKGKKIKKLAGDEENPINYYLTVDSVGYKFVISLIYLIGVFMYGIPLTVIAFCNVLLQLLAIIYSYILPIIALLSLFPKYSNGMVNSIITIGKLFMGKGALSLLVILFSLINVSLDLLIPQNSMVYSLLNLAIKGTIYYLAIKYRKELISKLAMALTTGNISMPGAYPNGDHYHQEYNRQKYHEQMERFEDSDYLPDYMQDTEYNPGAYSMDTYSETYSETTSGHTNMNNLNDSQNLQADTDSIQEIEIEDIPDSIPVDMDTERAALSALISAEDIPDAIEVNEPESLSNDIQQTDNNEAVHAHLPQETKEPYSAPTDAQIQESVVSSQQFTEPPDIDLGDNSNSQDKYRTAEQREAFRQYLEALRG